MTVKYEIKFLVKCKRFYPDEQVQYFGGILNDGSKWILKQSEVIEGIEKGKWEFFIKKDGHDIKVIVCQNLNGEKYIRSEDDGEFPNSLFQLPDCI